MASPCKRTGSDVDRAIDQAAAMLGYSVVKEEQREVVTKFVEGNDVFVALPTGFGKSLCYAILPAVFDSLLVRAPSTSIVLCVSPLVSLMQDQKGKFIPRGLATEFVGEGQTKESVRKVNDGLCQLVYISPESLLCNHHWRDMLQTPVYQKNLVALVVDEAHCVKKWGDQFRKAFSRIGEIRSIIPPNVHVMALTATATRHTRVEVLKRLNMKGCAMICRSPHKGNICLHVREKPSDLAEVLMPLVEKLTQFRSEMDRTIIYCKRYEEVTTIYRFFKRHMKKDFTQPIGAPNLAEYRMVDMYTKCTDAAVKESIVNSFSQSDARLRIVIATIAFGMGLDSPNVSSVIHWGPSSTPEDYVQEIGRAGRNVSIEAQATLYYSKSDQQFTSAEMMKYCRNKDSCRRQVLFRAFDEFSLDDSSIPIGCKCCDICYVSCKCTNCTEH